MKRPVPSPSQRQPLTAEALWTLQRVGGVSLAPDGRRAVCAVTAYDAQQNTGRSSLWLLDTAGGAPRQLTRCGARDGQAAWSPRGDCIAFIARRVHLGRPDDTAQLHLISPDGGEATAVTHFGPGVECFKWLPDGRGIVFAAWVWPEARTAAEQERRWKAWCARKETGRATSQAFYRHWDRQLPDDRALHLWWLDLRSGRLTDLFAGSALELPRDSEGPLHFDLRPDGRALVFAHDPSPEPRAGNRLVLSELDLKTRRTRRLADAHGWDFGAPRYSPQGNRLAALAAPVGRSHTALARLALIESEGRWHVLDEAWDRDVEGPLRWSADGQALYFGAQDHGRCHLWRHDLDQGAPTQVHAGGWVQFFDVAGGTVAVVKDGAAHPTQVWAVPGDAPARRIESFNDRLLARTALGEVREVWIKGAQNEAVQLWLTFPPGFDAQRPNPVTQVIHGGPHAAVGDSFSYRWNAHVLAAQGHVVAQLNYHGSSGFGQAFRDSLIGRQGQLELQDLQAATRWLRRQPWVDRQRMCAAGGSYGGFLVAWMNGHLPAWPRGPYRAYICHAGVFDRVATFSADSYTTRPKDLGAHWWDDMPLVLSQSPHARAAKMNTPTLVIHGAQDFRVPDCNGLAHYNTLKARGVPARLLWFPDENHWVLKPRNSLLWYREFASWLAQHAGPPPDS